MSDRQAWLRENLPTVASVVADFSAAFGRENFSVAYASENGKALGKKSSDDDGVSVAYAPQAKPCDGCRWLAMRQLSPDGSRQQQQCKRYQSARLAAIRCADFLENKGAASA